MPTYQYEREDGTVFEIVQKITEDALTECPETGQKCKRIIAPTAFHLKGSGWYKTDYAPSKKSNSTNESDSSKQAGEKKIDASTKESSTKADSKSESSTSKSSDSA